MKLLLALSSLSSLSSSTTAQTSGGASITNNLRSTIGESSSSTSSSSSSVSVSGYAADNDMSGNSGSLQQQQQRFLSTDYDYYIEKPLTQIANAQVQGNTVANVFGSVDPIWIKSTRFTATQWGGLGWTKPGGTYDNANEIGLSQLIDFWEAGTGGQGITLGFLDEAKRDAFLNFEMGVCWFEMIALDGVKPSFSFPISEAIGVTYSSNPYYGARWVYDTGGVLNSTMLDIATDM